MSKIQAAVIGSGFIGPVHVEAFRRVGIPVVGILDADIGRSREAAGRLQVPKAYATLDELLDDEQVQAVHIAVPNRFHYDMAKKSLATGKHVLCEKPLAMDSRQSAELVKLAAESGCAAGVNYNIRYYPLCIEAAEQVRSGRLGRLLHVTGSYVQDWLVHDTDFNWRVLAEEGGALRAIADIGTHWLDLIHAGDRIGSRVGLRGSQHRLSRAAAPHGSRRDVQRQSVGAGADSSPCRWIPRTMAA